MWPRVCVELLGPLQRVTPPADTVCALDEAKDQVRIPRDDTSLDAYLTRLLLSAQEYAELEIPGHRQFLTATYKLPLSDFWSGPLKLPRPPLVSVGSITYFDTAGTLQTVDPSLFVVMTPFRQPGYVSLAPRQTWPAVDDDRDYPVFVQFTCGYGDDSTSIPEPIRQAVLLIVAHSYRFRGDDDEMGQTSQLKIPPAAQALLEAQGWGSYA
jgi:uncharacterized phiE125 gp8 family phage protein